LPTQNFFTDFNLGVFENALFVREVFVVAEDRLGTHSFGINVPERVVEGVRIAVPTLWVLYVSTSHQWIGASEPPLSTRVVSRPEVIQPRFNVSFFLG